MLVQDHRSGFDEFSLKVVAWASLNGSRSSAPSLKEIPRKQSSN